MKKNNNQTHFPNYLKFKYSWRTYQERVLSEYKEHLIDNRLHVVAPPGSGKTVLGLEVARRINQPTLILSPNLTIRNQWKDRLLTDFMESGTTAWLSLDIKKPQFLTITTYQALHAAFRSDKKQLVKELKRLNIKTLVVDECHHLQKEWWRSLMYLVGQLTPTIVALTATPPYDVTGTEWQRYHELCGPTDIEISVAELVAAKNLCPHQDYIYFSVPTTEESKAINDFRTQLEEFIFYLQYNQFFIDLVKHHPFLQQAEDNLETIYEQPTYFSSLLIFLNAVHVPVPLNALGIIGADLETLPKMNLTWLELFLNQVLFKDDYFEAYKTDKHFEEIITELRKIGALERQRVTLVNRVNVNNKLRRSASKLQSIIEIVKIEYHALESNLRMVILTDYIRKEAMPKDKLDLEEVNLIGVVPIFELIRRKYPLKIEVGILTGSLVVIPKYSEKLFDTIALQHGLQRNDFKKKSLSHDNDYIQIECSKKVMTKLVGIITELFSKGGITVLVGTKSLLGEGWDAPAINTLVLATFVGSYVLSNQMRGRAIRTLKSDANKTANIWHLVCVDHTADDGGNDLLTLERRFKAFPGISFHQHPQIENGIDRFLLPDFPIDANKIQQLNQEMVIHANNRSRLRIDWNRALEKGIVMREEITVPVAQTNTYKRKKKFLYKNVAEEVLHLQDNLPELWKKGALISGLIGTIFTFFPIINMVATGVLGIAFWQILKAFQSKLVNWKKITDLAEQPTIFQKHQRLLQQIAVVTTVLSIATIAGIHWTGLFIPIWVVIGMMSSNNRAKDKVLIKQWKNYNEHLDIAEELKKIGTAVLYALSDSNLLHTALTDLELVTLEKEQGVAECFVKGGSGFDEQLFIESVQEVLSPIENPRYLLKTTYEIEKNKQETKFFAVPTILGRKKEDALRFLAHWKMYVNEDTELIFLRNQEGRKTLIKARGQSLIAGNYADLERLNAWK